MAEEPEELEITFAVEDGTCVASANSYVSLEYANQYMTNKGREDWLALTDEQKEVSLIKGTQYVDTLYQWKGIAKYELQELSFPRVDFRKKDGYIRDEDGRPVIDIPRCLKEAVCEAAFYGFQANAELFTVYQSETGNVKRDKSVISGAVEKEVEFFNTDESVVTYISKYAALDNLLRGLYKLKTTNNSVNAKAIWDY